ncbi:MAG: transglycosylase family protein [Euzebya sp.]
MSPRGQLEFRLALTGIVVVLVLALSLLFGRSAQVGSRLADIDPADPATSTLPPASTRSVTTPQPVAVAEGQTGLAIPVAEQSVSATPPSDTEPFTNVSTYRASVVVMVTPQTEAQARQVLATQSGVLHVAGITVTTTSLGGVSARIAEVDPDSYRPFTPPATANYQPLWQRIQAGDVAVTHEFGTTHDVPLGSRLATGLVLATGDPQSFRVGAFATNGTPPVADAILAEGRLAGDSAGVSGTRELLVALDPLASPTATAELLLAAGFEAREIPDPRLPPSDTVLPSGGITPDNVWDFLAQCESSGDWHINTGNGYYGGVQFLPESWAAVGGQGLPHENSREEQIYRATLLWQIQGWEAWPQCARRLGLIVDPPPEPSEQPTGSVRTESPE